MAAGAASGFEERFAALEPEERVAVNRVTSRKGESMSSIARAHGLTARQLAWYNPKVTRLKSGNLAAGQAILVPTRQTVSVAADVPNPALERYPRRAKTTAKAPAKGKTVVAAKKAADPVRKKTTH